MEKINITADVEKLISEADLTIEDKKVVEQYLSETFPKILIQPKIKADFANRSTSFFGGLPSLPSLDLWPVDDKGMAGVFIAQIDCAEIHKVVPKLFPESGLLFFFNWSGICEGEQDLDKYPTVLFLDIPSDTPPLLTLPKNYNGGDLLSDTWFYSAHASLSLSESRQRLPESILPRFDMEFWYQDEIRSSYKFVEQYQINAGVSEFLHNFGEQVRAAVLNQIRPKNGTEYCFLPPQAIRCHQYPPHKDKQYEWIDSTGYPWCGLNITMFMQYILRYLQNECRRESSGLEELWDEFGLLEKYEESYKPATFLIKPTYAPILAFHEKLDDMEVFLIKNAPDLLGKFRKVQCCESLVYEAKEWIHSYEDKPYQEPSEAEKKDFNQWIAEWLNAAILKSLNGKGVEFFKKTLVEGERLEGKPVKELSDQIQDLVLTKFRSEFRMALNQTTLDSSTILATHSPEAASRLPQAIYAWIDKKCCNDWPHYLLGHPAAVQHADEDNPDHCTLLVVHDDYRLMQACGGGTILQFWIKPEDLKNKVFDKVRPSGECT